MEEVASSHARSPPKPPDGDKARSTPTPTPAPRPAVRGAVRCRRPLFGSAPLQQLATWRRLPGPAFPFRRPARSLPSAVCIRCVGGGRARTRSRRPSGRDGGARARVPRVRGREARKAATDARGPAGDSAASVRLPGSTDRWGRTGQD